MNYQLRIFQNNWYYRAMLKEMSDQEPSTLILDVIFPLKFQDVFSGHDTV
jgi:hypothetical protein